MVAYKHKLVYGRQTFALGAQAVGKGRVVRQIGREQTHDVGF